MASQGQEAEEADRLAALLIAGAVPIPGHQIGDPVRVRHLGHGATNTAWRIRSGTADFLLRIPHRSADEAPRPMVDEFAALTRVPDGVGTRGIAFDDTNDNPLGCRYLLTTFVPGDTRPADGWTPRDFDHLADALTRLHLVDEPLAGPVHSPELEQVSLVKHLEAGLDWWWNEHPALFDDPAVLGLLPEVRSYVQRCEQAGGVATRFSLIHGDLIVGNVVLNGDQVGFIDWEWAELGDVAQDLAYIGGTVYGGPDYAPMSEDLITRFITRYVTGMRAAGKDTEDVPALSARRAGWEACERLLTMLHTMTHASPDEGLRRTTITSVRHTLLETISRAP